MSEENVNVMVQKLDSSYRVAPTLWYCRQMSLLGMFRGISKKKNLPVTEVDSEHSVTVLFVMVLVLIINSA